MPIGTVKIYQKRKFNRFIERLFELVNDESTDHLIRWNGTGEEDGFTIVDPFQLEEDVISKHFQLKDLKSFIRQLNMYDFRTKNKRQKCLSRVFYHPSFKKNDRQMLGQIKRKMVVNRRVKSPHVERPTIEPLVNMDA